MPDVSIVVLFTREAAMADRCLRAIHGALDPDLETELVLVLNRVPPETRDTVRLLAPDARVIESPVNTGTNAGWNLAFAAAQGRLVALLHEDSQPRPGWLRALARTARANPRAAVVGSRLLLPTGRVWSNGSIIWEDGHPTMLDADTWPAGLEATAPYHADSAASASMLVDRSAWAGIGGFDERFFPAMSTENDFCIAAWLAGRTVMIEPSSVVVHDTGAMVRSDRGALGSLRYREFLWRRARERLVDKWGGALSQFGPLRSDESAFTTTPDDVERAMVRAAARATTSTVPDGSAVAVAPSRVLTAPAGRDSTDVDADMVVRFDDAQRAVEREFSDWLLGKLGDVEEAFSWMTSQRDAVLAELERERESRR